MLYNTSMRAFAFSFVVLFIPFLASAASPLEGPIVPACSSIEGFEGACGLCDIFQLAQNLINFAVAFSVLVATIMFVYAGFLYFSASAKHDNIKKAHGIFWKVFIGFVFILGAWLIVSLIMSTLLNDKFSPWNGFAGCGVSSSVQQAPSAPAGGITTVPSRESPQPGGVTSPSGVDTAQPSQGASETAQSSCFVDADGLSQCFSSEFGCVVARSAAETEAKTSGSSVSQCEDSRSPQGASTPSQESVQPPEDEPTTQQGKQTIP